MADPGTVPGGWVDDDLLRAFGDQLTRLASRRVLVPEGSRLDASAFRILRLLVEEPRTLRELSDLLHLEQSTVNRQVNAAGRHGLLEGYAVPGEASRRHRPTAAGREAFAHDARLRAAAFTAALHELGPATSRRLADDLVAFNDALDRVVDRHP